MAYGPRSIQQGIESLYYMWTRNLEGAEVSSKELRAIHFNAALNNIVLVKYPARN